MTLQRAGMGIVEVIVALMLLSVGLLGLVSTAIVAQRSFTRAAAVERSARTAGALLDSLLATAGAGSGVRVEPGLTVSWTVARGGGLVSARASISAAAGRSVHHSTWQGTRAQ